MKRSKLCTFLLILILVTLFIVSATGSQCSPVKEVQEGVTKESPMESQAGQEIAEKANLAREV
jgi:hypothetical protein